MKAIRVQGYGGLEQLRYDDAPAPQPAQGQALVRVMAASVNPIDFKLASGAFRQVMPLTLPWIPGSDFSGAVATVVGIISRVRHRCLDAPLRSAVIQVVVGGGLVFATGMQIGRFGGE